MVTVTLRQLEERVRQVQERGGKMEREGRGQGDREVAWGEALVGAVVWPRGMVHEWFAYDGPPVGILGQLVRGRRLWSNFSAFTDRWPNGYGVAGSKNGQAPSGGGGGGDRGLIVWIGRACWPYQSRAGDNTAAGNGLFVDPRCDADRLWAIELCARSPAVAAVVADGRGLDMPATRRLQLAARDGDACLLLARPARELKKLSAAAVRWFVQPVPSPTCHPRWSVELLRCKGLRSIDPLPSTGALRASGVRWVLEYHDDAGLVPVPADLVDRSAAATPTGERLKIA